MSFAVDVNVLLYASDASSPLHARARAALLEWVAGPEVFCLAWPTVISYLRIATHSSIFASPLSSEEAMTNVSSLVSLPHVRLIAEEEGFWDVYREVAGPVRPRGALVPDAHLAAILRQHGVTVLHTNDRDFRRFDFLQIRNPFGQ
ncbi:PIN domain-containing protein [Candidatus Binatia bacterium]|nr:PIN domain-containing protein [Candidatus Binatia bacterium]